MCQSYALTNLPTEIRDVVSSYLDYRTAHAKGMCGVFAVITVRTNNSIDGARDYRRQPYGWQLNQNRVPKCRQAWLDILLRCHQKQTVDEAKFDPYSPLYAFR